jgi:hypothetical protein
MALVERDIRDERVSADHAARTYGAGARAGATR